MEIMHVIARMNVGGTAHYVGELVERIPESVLATGMVQDSEVEDLRVASLGIIRIPHLGRRISIYNDIRAWIEIRSVIRKHRPKIVHTHTFKAGLLGRLVGGPHKRIHTFHGHLFDDNSFSRTQKRIIKFLESFLAKRTHVLISVGENVGVEIRKMGIGVNARWTSIAPGVMPLKKIEQQEARRILDLDGDSVIVGWMARMTEVKNPFMFIEIARRFPNVVFVMAGGGNLTEEVRNEAPANVKVLGWAKPAIFWSAIDVAISTSFNEGMPIALIEAQLEGKPIIATNVGSTSEVVVDKVSGIIVENSIESFENAISTLLKSTSMRENMGIAARLNAEKQFRMEKMVQAHQHVYLSL